MDLAAKESAAINVEDKKLENLSGYAFVLYLYFLDSRKLYGRTVPLFYMS